MATTAEYWDIDGTELNTLAYNIESWGGSRLAPPPVRGENVHVPFRPGRIWVPKYADERIISLGMWVKGVTTAGAVPAEGADDKFNQNWDTLLNLFYRPYEQFDLTKRWYEATVLKSATARAAWHDGMSPDMWARRGATFVVDLMLADPYFYATEVTQTIELGTEALVHPGHDLTHKVTVEFHGPLTNPVLSNNRPVPDVSLSYTGVVDTGEVLTVDCAARTADLDGTPVAVENDGSHFYMLLLPGSQQMELTADAGTGHAVVSYQPNYV